MGSAVDIGMPTVEKHTDVMVPVQENKRLLVNDNEECINQFRELAEDEEKHPKSSRSGSILRFRIIAIEFLQRIVTENVEQGRCSPDNTHCREERQSKIPQGHGCSPVPWIPFCKVGFASRNENGIQEHGSNRNIRVSCHPRMDFDALERFFNAE